MSIDVEYAIKKDIRNNPVVREIDFEQKREFRRTLILAGLIVAMLLFSAWQHLKVPPPVSGATRCPRAPRGNRATRSSL